MSKEITQGGVSLPWVLTIIFIVLKFAGVISWSWWWVFSPLWISFLVGAAILLIIFIVFLVLASIDQERK